MLKSLLGRLESRRPALDVSAHCDGPCGVYDPADARIRAEAVLSMTKKILDLEQPSKSEGNAEAVVAYLNTTARFIAIKEEEAQGAKDQLLILWTDYFKPEHLADYPDLHDTFWQAAKLCSACKVGVDLEAAQNLMATVETIHGIFWATKGRDVAFYTAS
ncbi:MAG: superoxide dismutase, Ni [Caldilineaceae bacterium]|nr:superoxide dismutase, Ni [Caldilineaceae bacterium]